MTKEWAAVLICARIRGILARNRVRAKLTEVPHVVSITVIGAEGLSKTSLFMSPTPDAFVIANALAGSKDSLKKKKKNKCYSSAQTGVKEQSYNPQWQEDMRLTMVGMGNLVFNVFSRDSFGNSFLGQAVLNMYEHPSLYQDGAPVKVTIPVELPKYPIYNNKGELMSITPVSAPQGHITISCRVPSIYSNMCGWFTDIRANFFGAIGGEKMWCVLCEGNIYCYDSPFEGTLKYNFSSKEISDIREEMCDQLEIPIECLKVVLSPTETTPIAQELTWAWANDSSKIKALWRLALVKNHGSSIVSEKTLRAIDKYEKSDEYRAEMNKRVKK